MSQRNKANRRSPLRNRRGSAHHHNDSLSGHKSSGKRARKKERSESARECDCCDQCDLDQETIDFYKQYFNDNVYSTSPYRLLNFHLAVDSVLFAIGAFYVVFAPFTKVEESFNMQATHDMLFHGYLNLDAYDHLLFPGVVPRSFIGALVLSVMVYPWKLITIFILPFFLPISGAIHIQQQCQYLIRFSLLFLNIAALSKFRQSFVFAHFVQRADIYKSSDDNTAHSDHRRHSRICMIQRFSVLFALLTAAQFHFLFYCSRLLPNCFALPLVTVAFAEYFRNNFCRAVVCLAASTIWFRCDTIVIAVPFIVIMLITGYRRYSSQFCAFFKLFMVYGILGSVACILLTVLIDSWFWEGFGRLKWPEMEVLWFNTVDNQSSKWGTSPWRYYFWPLIPKMLLVNTVFMVFSVFKMYPMILVHEISARYFSAPHSDDHDAAEKSASDKQPSLWTLLRMTIDWESFKLLWICVMFVFLYSFLPHKESRFIFFIIPPCTLLSTIGCIRLLTLWGYRGMTHSQCTLHWFKRNLLERQRQLYFVGIPNESLLSSLVKKLVSLEALSFAALRKYAKLVCREMPCEIGHKLVGNIKGMVAAVKQGHCWQCCTHLLLPLLIVLGIVLSLLVSWYGVYEASYNYPGGVAITVFPGIVRDFKSNLTRYQHGYVARVSGQYYFSDDDDTITVNDPPHKTHKSNRTRHEDASPRPGSGRRQKSKQKENGTSNSKTKSSSKSKQKNKAKGKARKSKMSAVDKRHSELFDLYDVVNCVHIGNLAAISGVTRFMTPSFDREFRFSKAEELSLDDLSAMEDPCNLYHEMYSRMCPHSAVPDVVPIADKWDDDIYDEEYFERHDDYLGDSEQSSVTASSRNGSVKADDCRSKIDRRYPFIRGFDYLISEHSEVPGFHLVPHGTIYAKADSASTIKNMMHYLTSFIVSRSDCDAFLEPKLYVLKRTTEFDQL